MRRFAAGIAKVLGGALVVGAFGVGSATAAGAAGTVVTRDFHGTAVGFGSSVLSPNCFHSSMSVLHLTIARPGVGDWQASFQGCPGPGPIAGSVGFGGPLSLTTARGVTMSGSGGLMMLNNHFSAFLDITGSTGEYVGGRLFIDLGTNANGLAGAVSGTIDVLRTGPITRGFNGSFQFDRSSISSSPHCPPTSEFFDAAGTLRRVGRPDWHFTLQMCLGATLPGLGSFTITTPTGIVLSGTPMVSYVGTVFTFTLNVRQATREYTGGTLRLVIDTVTPTPGTVSGSLVVG